MTNINEDTDPILVKVQKLLDKAWSTTFPAEKESLLAKADALMIKHSLDQMALLDPNRPNTAAPIKGQEPELRDFQWLEELTYNNMEWEQISAMLTMFSAVADHLGCRSVPAYAGKAKVVGYPADLDFLEMMYLSLTLDFLRRVDPEVVPSVTWQQNLIALKQSGRKWEDIHQMLWDKHPDYPHKSQWQRKFGVQFTGIYKAWREANPDEPHNVSSPAMWRKDFCIGYVNGIRDRLYEMRQATVAVHDNLPALLNDKRKTVGEAFAQFFPPRPAAPPDPNFKPVRYSTAKIRQRAVSGAARAAGNAAAQKADLNQRGARVGNSTKGEIG